MADSPLLLVPGLDSLGEPSGCVLRCDGQPWQGDVVGTTCVPGPCPFCPTLLARMQLAFEGVDLCGCNNLGSYASWKLWWKEGNLNGVQTYDLTGGSEYQCNWGGAISGAVNAYEYYYSTNCLGSHYTMFEWPVRIILTVAVQVQGDPNPGQKYIYVHAVNDGGWVLFVGWAEVDDCNSFPVTLQNRAVCGEQVGYITPFGTCAGHNGQVTIENID